MKFVENGGKKAASAMHQSASSAHCLARIQAGGHFCCCEGETGDRRDRLSKGAADICLVRSAKVIQGCAFRGRFRGRGQVAALRRRLVSRDTVLRGSFYPSFHTSLALQSAGAKVASHLNLISYTLKVDILCKLAAARLRQSPRV